MKTFSLAALAALALVCLPLAIRAQPTEVHALVDGLRAHDCQVALAAALGLLAWALRRSLRPESFVHTDVGAVIVTGSSAAMGALVPVLQAGSFTMEALVGAITTGVVAATAMANPTSASRNGSRPSGLKMLVLLVGVSAITAGCADPLRQSATATLRTATVMVREFERFDHQRKRELSARVVEVCTPALVGPERDACVERESGAVRDYFTARRSVLDVLDGMEVSAGLVRALVDLDGPAPPELGTLVQKLGTAIAEAVTKVSALRKGGGR